MPLTEDAQVLKAEIVAHNNIFHYSTEFHLTVVSLDSSQNVFGFSNF